MPKITMAFSLDEVKAIVAKHVEREHGCVVAPADVLFEMEEHGDAVIGAVVTFSEPGGPPRRRRKPRDVKAAIAEAQAERAR